MLSLQQQAQKNFNSNLRQGFSLIELVFVLIIIAILGIVALPRFSDTRTHAISTQAKMTVTAIRNAISIEKQKRLFRHDFSNIAQLSQSYGYNIPIFDSFDDEGKHLVLDYPLHACEDSEEKGCWIAEDPTHYRYIMPLKGSVMFTLVRNRFICDENDKSCKALSR